LASSPWPRRKEKQGKKQSRRNNNNLIMKGKRGDGHYLRAAQRKRMTITVDFGEKIHEEGLLILG